MIHAETMKATGTPTADHHDGAGLKSVQAPHTAGVAPTTTIEAIAVKELKGLLRNAATTTAPEPVSIPSAILAAFSLNPETRPRIIISDHAVPHATAAVRQPRA